METDWQKHQINRECASFDRRQFENTQDYLGRIETAYLQIIGFLTELYGQDDNLVLYYQRQLVQAPTYLEVVRQNLANLVDADTNSFAGTKILGDPLVNAITADFSKMVLPWVLFSAIVRERFPDIHCDQDGMADLKIQNQSRHQTIKISFPARVRLAPDGRIDARVSRHNSNPIFLVPTSDANHFWSLVEETGFDDFFALAQDPDRQIISPKISHHIRSFTHIFLSQNGGAGTYKTDQLGVVPLAFSLQSPLLKDGQLTNSGKLSIGLLAHEAAHRVFIADGYPLSCNFLEEIYAFVCQIHCLQENGADPKNISIISNALEPYITLLCGGQNTYVPHSYQYALKDTIKYFDELDQKGQARFLKALKKLNNQ